MPEKPTILVTGGAGYIGSHACKALYQQGYTPVVYDNLVSGHTWAVQWGPLEQGDIRDRARLDDVIRRYQPEAVLHFAAHIDVGESFEKADAYYDNNVNGSLCLLETMRDHQLDKLIFSGTSCIYGDPLTPKIAEDHPQNALNPYGETKLKTEQHLDQFAQEHGIQSISLRYFNASGADPDGGIGEAHDPEFHLIPLVLQTALGQRDTISIFGNDYDTPDGTGVRDYVHVCDLAQAHLLALESLRNGASRTAYNLGNGHGYSVLEVIETARKVTGQPISTKIEPRRPGDPATLVCDSSRIRAELGWEPRFTDLEEIIATAWKWHSGT